MQLGANLPLQDIGGDPEVVRDYAQAAEEMGFDFLGAADHVIGVNAATRPDWGERNTSADLFHDPFVLYGFLSACTKKIGFSTQVLILAQRQAALVAKQAACVDVLSGGRFRLGVGIVQRNLQDHIIMEIGERLLPVFLQDYRALSYIVSDPFARPHRRVWPSVDGCMCHGIEGCNHDRYDNSSSSGAHRQPSDSACVQLCLFAH